MSPSCHGGGDDGRNRIRRRQMLASLGVAGALGLAGCGGGGNGGPGDTPTDGDSGPTGGTTREDVPHVSGQEFVMPTEQNPELMSFYWAFDFTRWLDGGTNLVQDPIVRNITHPRGFIANWDGYSDQVQLFQSDPIEEVRWMEPTIVTGDDVVGDDHIPADRAIQYEFTNDIPGWNDGTEMTATDFLPQQLYSRFFGGPPYDKFLRQEFRPQDSWAEVGFPDGKDGKKVQLTDPWGAVDQMGLRDYTWFNLWRGGSVNGGIGPSHLDPWKTGVENGLELVDQLAEQVANGESTDNMPGREGFTREHTPLDVEVIESYADPEKALAYGPWQPAEKMGSQALRLEPNPNWSGPQPNFDAVRLTWAPDEQASQRITASFQAGEYDFLSYNFEQSVQQNAPGKYEKVEVTSSEAAGLAFNGTHKDFGKRNVRAAIYYALDKETLASLIDPGLTTPYTKPGTEMLGMERLGDTLGEEWVSNNLIDYAYDTDRADQLMQDEGYTREGGTWVNSDGEEMVFDFPTDVQDTSFQEAVVDMLSDWGLELNLRTMDTATYEQNLVNGQYHIWSTLMIQTWPWVQHPAQVYFLMAESKDDVNEWRQYPQDDIDRAFEITGDDDFITREADDVFTLQIPPIGEPDGERSEFAAVDAVRTAREKGLSDGLLADSDLVRKFYWTYNWHLPQMVLLKTSELWWLNTDNWDWSPTKNHFLWTEAPVGTSYPSAWYSLGQSDWILADPENPKDGASVDN